MKTVAKKQRVMATEKNGKKLKAPAPKIWTNWIAVPRALRTPKTASVMKPHLTGMQQQHEMISGPSSNAELSFFQPSKNSI